MRCMWHDSKFGPCTSPQLRDGVGYCRQHDAGYFVPFDCENHGGKYRTDTACLSCAEFAVFELRVYGGYSEATLSGWTECGSPILTSNGMRGLLRSLFSEAYQ